MNVSQEIAIHSLADHHPDLPGPELLPSRVMRATALALPVVAAGISTFSRSRHRVPLGASDESAALAERLQFTVGEGPCLTAHARGRIVLATAEQLTQHYPAFHAELIARTPFRAIVSIPITDPRLGGDAAVDLYYDKPDLQVSDADLQDITWATAAIATLLAAGSGVEDPLIPGPVWLDNGPAHTRALVWTAMGIINVGLNLDSSDALAVLRGYAYSHDSTVDDVARSLTSRELSVDALGA